jgi:hypothetical protein
MIFSKRLADENFADEKCLSADDIENVNCKIHNAVSIEMETENMRGGNNAKPDRKETVNIYVPF